MKKHVSIFLSGLILVALFTTCTPIEGTILEVLEKAGGGGYTVTFVVNGGTPAPQPQKIERGGKAEDPGTVSLFDVEFGGWYTELSFIKKWDFDKDTVTKNINLYAKWNFILPLTNVNLVAPYLISQINGNNAANPVVLPVEIALGNMTAGESGWRNLLNAIETANKYVNLDLTICTMTGIEFNPNSLVSDGKEKIVSIILPDAAEAIVDGSYSFVPFNNFSSLTDVSGSNIRFIGIYAFCEISSLINVNFPKTEIIGNYSFYTCTSLKNISFPSAVSFGANAFANCTNLENIEFSAEADIHATGPFYGCPKLTFTLNGDGFLSTIEGGRALVRNGNELISYPSASGTLNYGGDGKITTIGTYAFHENKALQSVMFLDVTDIKSAFSGCTSLQYIYFPNATTIASRAFDYCDLHSVSLPKITHIEGAFFWLNNSPYLTITLGPNAPTLGGQIFLGASAKDVTIIVSTLATGYTSDWIEGFKGRGFDEYGLKSGEVNDNINVIIEYY